MKTDCKRITIPTDCCGLSFIDNTVVLKGKRKYAYSKGGFETVRGEELIIDFDHRGFVMSIELLGSKEARKPCQEREVSHAKKVKGG